CSSIHLRNHSTSSDPIRRPCNTSSLSTPCFMSSLPPVVQLIHRQLVNAPISTETGMKAYTVPEFERSTIDWVWRNTGIPSSFMTTIILGFLVGVAVCGQTFYSFVLENLKNLGALKAMGASNGLLAGMLLLQAMTVGVIGFGIGLGLTAIFGIIGAQKGSLPFKMVPLHLLQSFGAVLVICVLAALFGIRKVARLEPAVVFRG
ncbi:MAG: ABC transporter permease, partial [Pedosphaera sp.]|nr:ABC transporter permease [Pedosphaera sp.]